MKLKPNPDDEKMRAWLTDDELDALYEQYDGEYEQQIALKLMGECGLRSHEVLDVSRGDIRQMDAADGGYKLRVREGKGEKYRETVIPNDLRRQLVMHCDYSDIGDGEPVIDVTRRTLRNWVRRAADSLEEQDDGWHNVTTHDLRRSWAGRLVNSEVSASVIMELGGWSDYRTFRDHYLNEVSDKTVAREMAKVAR